MHLELYKPIRIYRLIYTLIPFKRLVYKYINLLYFYFIFRNRRLPLSLSLSLCWIFMCKIRSCPFLRPFTLWCVSFTALLYAGRPSGLSRIRNARSIRIHCCDINQQLEHSPTRVCCCWLYSGRHPSSCSCCILFSLSLFLSLLYIYNILRPMCVYCIV